MSFAYSGWPGGWPFDLQGSLLAMAGGSVLDELVFGRLDRIWVFLFVLIAIAAVVWGERARRLTMRKLGKWSLVSRLVQSVHRPNRNLNAGLAVLAVALVATALLRLQYGGVAKVRPTTGLDIVVAVDYSKSMLASDVYPSRSERLEAELQRFLDEADRRGDHVGVVVFAGAARGLPLTSDMRLLRLFLERADPRSENPGGTAIGKALNMSLQFLLDARVGQLSQYEARDGQKDKSSGAAPKAEVEALVEHKKGDQVIVLLTDGEDNASEPLKIADEAARLGIKIFAVGIGSTSGEPVVKYDDKGNKVGFQTDKDGNYVVTRLDEKTLKTLAEKTQGRYVHVRPEEFGLDKVLEAMSTLSRAQRENSVEILREEGYAVFVVPALLMLMATLVISERRKAKVA